MKAYSLFLAMLTAGASTLSSAETSKPLGAAPNLDHDLKNIVFEDLWERPGLSKRDRSLVTVTATVAKGQTASLPYQFTLALENGVTPQELAGLITHAVYYSGLNAALEAEPILAKVFAEQGIKPDAVTLAKAEKVDDESAAKAQRDVVNNMVGDVSPGLAHFSNTALNGDLWLRDDLAPRDRSLVTVAALITQGNVEQLPVHVRKGVGNGLTAEELGEVIAQLAFYAGWPRAFSAAGVIKSLELK